MRRPLYSLCLMILPATVTKNVQKANDFFTCYFETWNTVRDFYFHHFLQKKLLGPSILLLELLLRKNVIQGKMCVNFPL